MDICNLMRLSDANKDRIRIADDFCDFAIQIRKELLNFPEWIPMTQISADGSASVLNYNGQTGITTGHLGEEQHADNLSFCYQFHEFIFHYKKQICDLFQVPYHQETHVETNAMAYGNGGWFSGHTDTEKEYGRQFERCISWILYLTPPEHGEWSESEGGGLKLRHPEGIDEVIYPKFNRLVVFKVENMWHEVTPVETTMWETCRLSLSGWIKC